MTVTLPAPTRPILRYHGGKWLLAEWIISHFPPHRIYTEAFGGAGSVLLRKPRSYAEILNDIDGEVVNLFRVLRDPDTAAALTRALVLTPYARAEFDLSYVPTTEPIEQARRTVCRAFMGYGTTLTGTWPTGFRNDSKKTGSTPAHDWTTYPPQVARFCQRLQGVVIDNEPAITVLKRHDSPQTLHYVDPPYPHSERGRWAGKAYHHEMTDDDHRELATVLHQLSGFVVISGYSCALYDEELFPDWRKVQRSTHADGANDRVECLWISPNTPSNQLAIPEATA